jgi:hypothetical protein
VDEINTPQPMDVAGEYWLYADNMTCVLTKGPTMIADRTAPVSFDLMKKTTISLQVKK